MRKNFDDKLDELNSYLVEMGMLVERAITLTNKGLVNQSVELAKDAIACDKEIDDMEKEIESMCLKLLLLHQHCFTCQRLLGKAASFLL